MWNVCRTDRTKGFGQLRKDGIFFAYTIENPKTYIPNGTWIFKRYLSPRLSYEVWCCDTIPNRTKIAIHIANFADQLIGCTALGLSTGKIDNKDAVLESKIAFNKFMKATSDLNELKITYQDGLKIVLL